MGHARDWLSTRGGRRGAGVGVELEEVLLLPGRVSLSERLQHQEEQQQQQQQEEAEEREEEETHPKV